MSDIEAPPTADCSACPFQETLRPSSRCKPGDVCVQAESGRQIDRFLKRNPELAPDYLCDVFWERRAIAVRYVPTDAVLALIDDEDEVVRRLFTVSMAASIRPRRTIISASSLRFRALARRYRRGRRPISLAGSRRMQG